MLKFKRINAGYYRAIHNNDVIEITKTFLEDGTPQWYYQINNEDVHDQYFYKRTAVYAANLAIFGEVK